MHNKRLSDLVITATILPMLLASIAFPLITGLPDVCMDFDMAMIELYTRNAMEGNQFVGMYSRFGWNHLGPTYFYMLTSIYMLAEERSSSLMWGALMINTLVAVLICLILRRVGKNDVALVISSSLLLALLLIYIGVDRLASPWTPWAIALPFLLFIYASAVFSAGEISYLPLVFTVGSFLVQTHIGTVPTVLALAGISCVLYTLVGKPWALEKRRICLFAAIAIAAVSAMWFLPIVEEISNYQGNFSKIVTFFTESHSSASWNDSLYAVTVQLSWFPLALLRRGGLSIPDFEYELLSVVFAFVQVVGLVIVLVSATKRSAILRARICVIGIIAVFAGLWSASRVEGDIFSYLLFWISSIGCVNWALLLAESGERLGKHIDCYLTTSTALIKPAILVVSLFLTAVTTSSFLRFSAPTDSPQIRTLSEALITYLQEKEIMRPVFLFNWSSWPTDSGLILQLHKKHIPFATQNVWKKHSGGWPLLLGQNYQPSRENTNSIIVERESSTKQPRSDVIARYADICVFVKAMNTTAERDDRREKPAETSVGKQ